MASPPPGRPLVSCPRDGSKWFTCNTGSMFVGCCKLDPCKYGCEEDFVGSALLSREGFGLLPEASCSNGSNFYTCGVGANSETFYWGCCKSNPCASGRAGCPAADNGRAFMKYSSQMTAYLKITAQNTSSTYLGATAKEAPLSSTTKSIGFERGHLNARIQVGICLALLVAVPMAVALWLYIRTHIHRPPKSPQSPESVPFSISSTTQKQHNHEVYTDSRSKDIARIGWTTVYVLLSTSVIILAATGLLSFLWLADYTNNTWSEIMIRNWATRAVSLTALSLRTAVDFQAAIATAVLVSLLLESRTGIQLCHLADLSPMRTGAASPWSFARFVIQEGWKSTKIYKRNFAWALIAVGLLATTSILQFSSTILLSDLKTGPLGGHSLASQVRTGLSYNNITRRITRDSAWTSNPPFYPVFGEYAEQLMNPVDGVSDTGLLLRAFLPYATVEARQNLRSYNGKAMLLDARVLCQAPKLTKIGGTGHYAEVTGEAAITQSIDMLQTIDRIAFSCSIAGQDEYSMCQLGQTFPAFVGSLKSQFENSTSYGTAFLVAKGTKGDPSSNTTDRRATKNEWTEVTFSNGTSANNTAASQTSGAAFSLCFAPWDASILDVSLTSTSNRTEPLMQWWDGFKTAAVIDHLLPDPNRNDKRQILQLQKPRNFLGDLPPQHERPLVQSDASGSSAAEYGSNTPLPENWSIFFTGEPYITLLNKFSRSPKRAIAADPALAAIFTDTMAATGSIAWAMSSLITVLSMTNYYSQLPAFDRLDNVTMSLYVDVLYPQQSLGFMSVLWVLVAHYAIVAMLVVLFVRKTRFTLLGNAWSAFSQMAESPDVKAHIGAASLKSDAEVVRGLGGGKNANLRARVVKRGDAVEVVVE